MADIEELETFCPESQQAWREWLQENHREKQSIWVIYYRKGTNMPSITWSEAVDQALCFGWIDSTRRTIDQSRFMQLFTRRKARSMWSKINKDKVAQLIAQGLMTPAGLDSVELAKQNGSWNTLDEVDALIIPPDLEQALSRWPVAKDFFLNFSRTDRMIILTRIVMAKRPETRAKRIEQIAAMIGEGKNPAKQ